MQVSRCPRRVTEPLKAPETLRFGAFLHLSDEVHRALRVRVAHHGRSTEAEIREILEVAARPPERIRLGSLLVCIAREAGGLTEAEAEQFNQLRDKTPAEPMRFE